MSKRGFKNKQNEAMIEAAAKGKTFLLMGIILGVTLAVYVQVYDFAFLTYDDQLYLTNNEQVQRGLTWDGFGWAIRARRASNWHPLTWLAHMLDCEWFGLNAGAHHLVNVFFHLANTMLLFLVFQRMTKAVWKSALVAALFALHPLHVESVAWVSERKDVLSTFFWLLTMWAYVLYAQKGGWLRYVAVVLFLGLGLLAKPMLVTLPLVLVLLDFWPLERLSKNMPNKNQPKITAHGFRPASFLLLAGEKMPLLVLTGISCIVTYTVQQGGSAVQSTEAISLGIRLANAVASYGIYLLKMIYPMQLSAFYYHHGMPAVQTLIGAGAILAALTLAAILWRRRRPYLLVGWFWFLGTLLPVIGLVQVGGQSRADRYTYVPLIGLFITVVWGVGELMAKGRRVKILCSILAGLVMGAMTILTWRQVSYWRNTTELFQHALKFDSGNHFAHYILAGEFSKKGEKVKSREHYLEALKIRPNDLKTHQNFAAALTNWGQFDAAIKLYQNALRLDPDNVRTLNNYGLALVKKGNYDEAIKQYRRALRFEPDNYDLYNNLGQAYFKQGKYQDAVELYRQALRLRPENAGALSNLGAALFQSGRFEEAIKYFQKALELDPAHTQAQQNLEAARARLNIIKRENPLGLSPGLKSP